MKKFIFIASIALVIALILGGCAGPAATPAPKEVITLKYNNQNPEAGWDAQHSSKPMLRAIEEATGGRIKFEEYFGQTLTKGVDSWEATKSGIADLSWCFFGYWPGMTTVADVVALPFMPFQSAEQGSGILWQLYEKYPSLSAQMKDNKIVWLWTTSAYFLINNKREVKTMEDLKGLKLRVAGGPPTDQMKLLGVSPMMVGMPDTYVNIQKGVVDGMAIVWEAIYSFKQYEVVKYYSYAPLHSSYFAYAMNLNTWNSLPSDIQNQIMSVGGLKGSTFYGKNMFDTIEAEARATIKQGNYPMIEYTIPADELAKWTKVAGEPLWEAWVKAREAEGVKEAREILNTTLDLTKSYKP